jgi:hypothetical protein
MRCLAWVLAPGLLLAQGMGSGSRPQRRAAFKAAPRPQLSIREVPSGLTAKHRYGDGTSRYILGMTGNGVAILDYDNDGAPDLLFNDGVAPVLYRNNGAGRFTDVSASSGLAPHPWGQGVCAGDFDNDGWTDVLLTYYGVSRLYRNDRGTFREAALPIAGSHFSTGCAFVDYNRDGLLDIVIANYVAFDLERAQQPGTTKYCTWQGLDVFCGPRGLPTDRPMLFKNEGGGRFRDVSATALKGVEGLHYGLGVAISDFDGDGWMDIYIACDSTPGILLRNNRDGTLTDVAVEAGAAYGADGEELGSMGVAVADFDGDGLPDIVKSNFIDESPSLYRNLGDWLFADATAESGLGADRSAVGWGVGVVDMDLDGRPDIVIANGHIYPELKAAYPQTKSLYWNAGKGVFSGWRAGSPAPARGLAAGDLDGDGRAEIVVANRNAPPSVFKVDGPRGNSLGLRLEGKSIGARVRVTAGGRTQMDEVRGGGSYASQNDFTLLFGLGAAVAADRIEIRWPDGETETLEKVASGARYTVRQGGGIVGKTPWK